MKIFEYRQMKKAIIRILTLALFGFGLNSCNNLDQTPLDKVVGETFYKTKTDFDGAVLAGYSSIQDFWGTSTETLSERGEFWVMSTVITDDVEADASRNPENSSLNFDRLLVTSTDVAVAAIYSQIYEGILRANIVIEEVQNENELTDAEKKVFDAEAKFLRAFFHFQAMKIYGTPPLAIGVNKEIFNQALPNATKDELFASILSDFQAAADNLPASRTGGELGRATSWAAKAFIGKVNVWKKDWASAISSFEDVINNGPYALEANYGDVFAYDNENNIESIFEIQYGGPYSDDNLWVFDDTHSEAFKASQGTGRTWYWDAANGAPGGKLGWWVPSQDLVDAYEAGDIRLTESIYQDGDTYYTTDGFAGVPYDPAWSSTGYTIKKYRGARNVVSENHAPNLQADFNNERWFRFAELKLLYAEALLESGRAADATVQINDIRNRAGLADLSATATIADLQQEKRVELAFEPHRWFDIVRWDIGSTVFTNWDSKLEVFPFPQAEIDRSGGILKQNTGY